MPNSPKDHETRLWGQEITPASMVLTTQGDDEFLAELEAEGFVCENPFPEGATWKENLARGLAIAANRTPKGSSKPRRTAKTTTQVLSPKVKADLDALKAKFGR